MKLLIVACALCLVTSAVTGVFLGDSNGGLLGQLGEHFGGVEGQTGQAGQAGQAGQVKPSGSRKANGRQSDAPPGTGLVGEIETSLEQAAGVLDGLWRRFKKGVLRLLPGFGFPVNGKPHANGTSPGNLPQPKPISTTTMRIITATTTERATTTTTNTAETTTTLAIETTTAAAAEVTSINPIP